MAMLLLLCLFSTIIIAADKPLAVTDNEPFVKTASRHCVIPFTRAGNLIVLRARADSIEGNFILDTGAPKLVLNMTYFRDYPATGEDHFSGGGITQNGLSNNPTRIGKLETGGISFSRIDADRINLGHIENAKGIKILGLIGMQLLKRFELFIDYQSNELHFRHINTKEERNFRDPRLSDKSLYDEFDIDLLDEKLITYGRLGGKKLTFIIDTGAESNVIDSRLPNHIFEKINITNRVVIAGTSPNKVEALYGDMDSLMIGSRSMGRLRVLVTNLEKMCFAYDKCLDGMLGFDFLARQRIGFNFVKKKMYIWK